ncbi:hypothetical protein L914_01547 [Phytophthora nicotianae]|uniref:BZIP domain-containing protein n=2 Tax=Phytophthora nicotianae TaxID=4792 RepID=V9FXC8_PHYNI|nr:hypothetical protein F443_01640 [Phytophthora nicotianae P1569]ETM55208.1 hypothetical protein L914_01547 [Phytophthora nicotianae]
MDNVLQASLETSVDLAFQYTTRGLSSTLKRAAPTRPMSNTNQIAISFHSQPLETSRAPTSNAELPGLKCHRDNDEMDKFKRLEVKKAIRREQCRKNQTRHRRRKCTLHQRIQHEVQQLREEVQGLKLNRQLLRFEKKTNRSAWNIVSDVFRLLEIGFCAPWHMVNADEMMKHTEMWQILVELLKSFEQAVGMEGLHGVEMLLEQLRRYSLYFSEPQVHLQRVEELVPGVVTVTARLKLTVSEFTLRCVFPRLERPRVGGDDVEDIHRSLRNKLLGRRLDCLCKVTFPMNEESGRVSRLEICVPANLEEVPAGVTLVGGEESIPESNTERFIEGRGRFFCHRFHFPYGSGFRYRWRWWKTFGRPIYGPRCLFGRPIGGFFYC